MFPTDRLFIRIASIMALIAVLCFIGFGLSYCHQRNVTKRAQISERMARGETAATNAATSAVIEYAERQTTRDATTNENRDKVMAAENANVSAGSAGDAGYRVLCERPAYRSDPVCVRIKGSAAAR